MLPERVDFHTEITMRPLILASLFALSACDERVRIATPPVDLLTCQAMPVAPDLPERDGTDAAQSKRDEMTLDFVLELRSAYASCAGNLLGVKRWAETVD